MAKTTKIQWADATWNPFIGCHKVSPACNHCYAEVWAKRCGRDFNKVVRAATATFHSPLKWPEPKRIFVCSLSDFFHPDILRPDRHNAIHVMRRAPQHTYMLLTKRPENIKPMLAGTAWAEALPPNVWVGVTAENQEQADKRIPLLLDVPARVRFVSCEPLLGEIELLKYVAATWGRLNTGKYLHWVIAGGESGGKARPMHPSWARKLRDDCEAAGIPFMFKQNGEWRPYKKDDEFDTSLGRMAKIPAFIVSAKDGTVHCYEGKYIEDGVVMLRIGKTKSGRLLDGKEHNATPS